MNGIQYRFLIILTASQILGGITFFKYSGGDFSPQPSGGILVLYNVSPWDNIPLLFSWMAYLGYLISLVAKKEKRLLYVFGFALLLFQVYTGFSMKHIVIQIWTLVLLYFWVFIRSNPKSINNLYFGIRSFFKFKQ